MDAIVRVTDAAGATDPIWVDDNAALGPLVDYTFSEYTTPVAPGDTAGGTPQITVSGISMKRSRRTKGKTAALDLPTGETVLFNVTQVQDNADNGTSEFTGDALINRLNVDVVAYPVTAFTEPPLSIYANAASRTRTRDLFVYYAGLVGIAANQVFVDADIADDESATVGFSGNLWSFLKDLCTARGYQMYSTGQNLCVTTPGKIELYLDNTEPVSPSFTIQTANRSQAITVQNYNWKLLDAATQTVAWKATEVYSVAAGEVQENTIDIDGSVNTVFNPVAVTGMDLDSLTAGQYVVTGSDGYIVSPQFWADNDGSVTVKIGENPSQLIVTIVGARDLDRSPYRISEGAADRPALWITGRGIATKKETITIYTGDSTAPTKVTDIDNIFIGSRDQAFERGVLAAEQYNGNNEDLSISGIGTDTLRLVRKAYTDYAVAPNILTDDQASVGRKNGIRGWGSYKQNTLTFDGTGIRISVVGVPIAADILHNIPMPNTGIQFDGPTIFTNRAWLNPVIGGATASAAFTVNRISGTQKVRAVIYWFDLNGMYVSTTNGSVTVLATGTPTTVSVAAVAPTGGTYRYAMIGLQTNVDTLDNQTITDLQVTAAQFALGNVPAPTAFVDHAAQELTSNFGFVSGSVLKYGANKFRVLQADYGPDTCTLKLAPYTSVGDFNDRQAGATVGSWQATLDSDLTLDQFMGEVLL